MFKRKPTEIFICCLEDVCYCALYYTGQGDNFTLTLFQERKYLNISKTIYGMTNERI